MTLLQERTVHFLLVIEVSNSTAIEYSILFVNKYYKEFAMLSLYNMYMKSANKRTSIT